MRREVYAFCQFEPDHVMKATYHHSNESCSSDVADLFEDLVDVYVYLRVPVSGFGGGNFFTFSSIRVRPCDPR